MLLDLAPLFVEPAVPVSRPMFPLGPTWLYEPKLDGWRIQIHKAGDRIALLTKKRRDICARVPDLIEAIRLLPAGAAIIDGEIVASTATSPNDFDLLQSKLKTRRAIGLSICAFDLLWIRKRTSARCRRWSERGGWPDCWKGSQNQRFAKRSMILSWRDFALASH